MKNLPEHNNQAIFSGQPLSIRGGVLSYTDTDFYWEMKISRSTLKQCNEAIEAGMSFTEAVQLNALDPVYTTAAQRADFIFTIPFALPKDRPLRILDLGSGFGNITRELAQRFPEAEIIAADASRDILQFLSHRLESEGKHNVTCVHIPPLEARALPFRPESFDIIFLNGVLEWVGAGVPEGNPRTHQIAVLEYLKTLLSADGVLYIGIENRYFFNYFFNVKDPHSGLRFTSVLPRRMANRLSMKASGKPYRTYLYSHHGYKSLFTEATFVPQAITSAFVWASYKDPFSIIPIQPRNKIRRVFKEFGKNIFPTWRSVFLFRMFALLRLEVFFAPSFLFYISKSGFTSHASLAARYFEQLTGGKADDLYKLSGSTRDDGSVYFLGTRAGKRWNLKIPRQIKSTGFAVKGLYTEDVYEGSPIRAYPYVAGRELRVSELFKAHVFSFIRASHELMRTKDGIPFRHGDLTPENIIVSSDKSLHLIDFDDVVAEPQLYDLCDYFLHIARIVKKLAPHEAAVFLTSQNVLSALQLYKSSVGKEDWIGTIRTYLQKKEASAPINRAHYRHYLHDLSVLLSGQAKH
jgi:SAM-dependent methyltransferase